MEKLNLGFLYRNSNSWWNIPYITQKLSAIKNIEISLFDVSNPQSIIFPNNLNAIALLPSEAELIPSFLSQNKNIYWVHSMFAGVDKFLSLKEISDNKKIILTNSRGAFADSLSEFGIFSMLFYSYNSPAYIQAYSQKKWIRPTNKMLKDKTLIIVGYGYNGANLASKAKAAFDMKIIGVRKNIQNEHGKEFLNELVSIEKLDEKLPEADFIISFLPHTLETKNIFNLEKFEKMKNTCVFINLGRGSSVVEEDLVKILKQKRILGASLDVTQNEPLNENSELYELENVFLSCHSADNTDEYFNQAVEVFIKNLKLFLDEGKFYSEVDKIKGY